MNTASCIVAGAVEVIAWTAALAIAFLIGWVAKGNQK
jgi:hypothetical protein